jgi:heme/flavin dehydrogenase (mycofactocin system)
VPAGWFESVAEAQRRSKRRLPRAVYKALIAGAERGQTARDNVSAFAELGLTAAVAAQRAERDLATTVLGRPVALPVLISPIGVQAVHPDGEIPIARAAAARGTTMCLSCFASRRVEDVVAANPQTCFQLHWSGTRDQILHRLERARAAGVVGLVLTLDWSFSQGRDWNSPAIPERLSLPAMLRFAPEALRHPQWLVSFVRSGHLPDLTVPNMATPGDPRPTFFGAYREWSSTPLPTWDDVGWLREQWGGPFLLKGITRVDDAKRAVDAGATAISVSNHGGNNLDGTPATIRVLAAIAAAVGGDVETLLDGGIRRGSDVVKALALGARAVLIGRAGLWGLAANGQSGVENVLDLLRDGIDAALRGLGHGSLRDLSADDLIIPGGFSLSTGGG